MRKAQSKYIAIMAVGVIVVCLLALLFVLRSILPNMETSPEGQAKAVANMIAMSADGLAGSDAGTVDKDFSLKQPLTIEVYDKSPPNKAMYIKVTYDQTGSYYEMPLLAAVEPAPSFTANRIWVIKEMGGKIVVAGNTAPGYLTSKMSPKCIQPSDEDIKKFIISASTETGVEQALIKAVMTRESSVNHCRLDGSYTLSQKNAVGLMQLTEIALAELRRAKGIDINPYDAEQNVRGGSVYLSMQVQAFKQYNDVRLALAAYNAGPTRIQNLINKYGGSWESIKTYAPDETQKFVSIVNDYYANCFRTRTASCSLKECRLC